MTSGADLKHRIHKGDGPIIAEKDKDREQASNDDTHCNTNVFSRSIKLISCFLATWITF